MPARTTLPEEPDELLALQRRAYGPAAEALDAAGLARLRELEAPPRAPGEPRAEEPPTPVPAEAPAEEAGPPAGAPAPRSVRPSRRSGGIAAAAVLGCALIGGGLSVEFTPPGPDAVLLPGAHAEMSEEIEQTGILDFLGFGRSTDLVAYEVYRGMQVYTFTGSRGDECLIVGGEHGFVDFGCGRGRVHPTVDLMLGRRGPTGPAHGSVDGSFARLLARDGTVEVWLEQP
ncbi:hypothetical protein NQ166_09090 [Microbacterium sp. zg.Y1090]|uniref:hypothetical protein n=1 Tax=Microbacterium TaxID=33882 RepID=UPI00214B170B|nr:MULTISPECIES: hypothetical protein [unclassified Microbacterium]MCR2811597.1 hypothetical protein [Microbacterium sp. zg.Y1084]MCR2818981.1 hypothetical protein [Microbacterium sp. zg.Y1090]MDL5487631.1 hypothetical protein [Microbacterium sp. zg-Y1211]WIM27286.1 hypothetical protein QNO26_08900 [Microbacterium sp. zg-Y1090]